MRDDTPEMDSELFHVRDYQSRRCPLRSAGETYAARESEARATADRPPTNQRANLEKYFGRRWCYIGRSRTLGHEPTEIGLFWHSCGRELNTHSYSGSIRKE
jgi:hypothetical protein